MTALHDNIEARFPPAGLAENGWGIVNTNKSPMEGGAPEWCRNFEAACRWHERLVKTGAPINWHGLGFCFGGISNHSTTPAADEWHGNLSAAEADARGKPAGALYRRPSRIACIDYDHVIDPATGLLRADLAPERAGEINIFAAVFPTEVSMSGTGLHVVFEKPDGWPSFGKIVKDDREVFSEAGYVIFTGNWWQGATTLDDPEMFAETKEVALDKLMEIVRQGCGGTTVLPAVGKPAGEVRRTKSPVEAKGFCPIGITPEQFAEWKRRYTAVDICMRNGYRCEGDRLTKPGSKHTAGVMIQEYGEYVYSHHANDPLGDGNHHDAYDCLKILECGGSDGEAAEQILKDLGENIKNPAEYLDAEVGKLLKAAKNRAEKKDVPELPNPEPQPEPKKEKPKPQTLEEIADEIGQLNAIWIYWENKGKPDEKASIDLQAWRQLWQDKTRLALDADNEKGLYWYDGIKWQHLAHKQGFLAFLTRALNPHPYVVQTSGWTKLPEIASLRDDMVQYGVNLAKPEYIYCNDGNRVSVDASGIHIVKADPAREVWLNGINVSGSDIYEDLTTVEFDVLYDRFPKFKEMMAMCDSEDDIKQGRTHGKLMAAVAGAVIYSRICRALGYPALDVIFWLYDLQLSRTGKSTHANMLARAFDTLATAVRAADLFNENGKTGNMIGTALVVADEAGDCWIKDAGLFKALPSGTATLRKMYCEPVQQQNPIVIVAAANSRPKIRQYAVTDAIRRRLIPFEYTLQQEAASLPICGEDEANRAIINLGLWQVYRIIKCAEGGKSGRDAFVLQTDEDDIDRLFDWVDWEAVLGDMLIKTTGEDKQDVITIATLRRSLIWKLVQGGLLPYNIPKDVVIKGGKTDLGRYGLDTPLRSDRAFMQAIKNKLLEINVYDHNGVVVTKKWRCGIHKNGHVPGDDQYSVWGVRFFLEADRIEKPVVGDGKITAYE